MASPFVKHPNLGKSEGKGRYSLDPSAEESRANRSQGKRGREQGRDKPAK